jgi:hypothetical protein
MRRTFLVLLDAALVLGACGSDDDNKSSTSGATTTRESDATSTTEKGSSSTAKPGGSTTAVGNADEVAEAKKIAFQPSDFPQGWTSSPATPDDADTATFEADLYACLAAENPKDHQTSRYDSPDYSKDQSQASSGVLYVKTQADATGDLAVLDKPNLPACIERAFNKIIATSDTFKGVKASNTKAERLPNPAIAHAARAARLSVTLKDESGENSIDLVVDFAFIFDGRREVSLSFSASGPGFDPGLEASVTKAVDSRL